ncbi:MAG: hypothetical protein FJY29_12710 [Betaproteobacteria bacterium]|nr:hypothetical protein [Betaproteobacteria bacterium]
MTSRPQTNSGQIRRSKGTLLKVSQFLYVIEGQSFSIQLQESPGNMFTAYAESTSDPHEAFRPVSGSNLEDVLQSITHEIDKKVSKW